MNDVTAKNRLEEELESVKRLMAEVMGETVLRSLLTDCKSLLGNGKLLRSRLLLRVGAAAGVAPSTLRHAAAAVELIHAASLLHDDVIDGGFLRRNLPTFWSEKGVPGAILVGDLMLFKALDVAGRVEDGQLVHMLVHMTGEVCDAESEQELVLRGHTAFWEHSVRIARRKTGSLFAFAAHACGGNDAVLCSTLRDAGYAIGTAYQLADDILDATGDEAESGKTLGTDQARAKTTAAAAWDGPTDASTYVDLLCRQAADSLISWPAVHTAWCEYVDQDVRPALARFLSPPTRTPA